MVDRHYKHQLRDHLYELELDSERVMNTVIQNKAVWQDLAVTNLYQNIQEDGVPV